MSISDSAVRRMGLVCIMAGATAITLQSGMGGGAAVPAVVGALAGSVALGRRAWLA